MLLPGEVVPLHIFEERYRTMIGECLEAESEFGIVWLGDEVLQEVGCTARDHPGDGADGRRPDEHPRAGPRPFRLERRIDDLEYPAGDIELLDEESDEARAEAGRRPPAAATPTWSSA